MRGCLLRRVTICLLVALGIFLGLGGPTRLHALEAPEPSTAEGWLFIPSHFSLGAQTGGGFSPAHSIREAKLYALVGRVGYVFAEQHAFLPGSAEVVLEPNYFYVWEGSKTSNLVGLTLNLKYNFRTGTRLVPFLEGGGGASYATTRIPPGQGTNFNFIGQGGLGLQYLLSARTSLDLLAIFHHLSNANTGRHNPSLNSFILSLGVSYYF